MLRDFERADRIGEFWGYPESRAFAELPDRLRGGSDASAGARRHAAGELPLDAGNRCDVTEPRDYVARNSDFCTHAILHEGNWLEANGIGPSDDPSWSARWQEFVRGLPQGMRLTVIDYHF